MKYYLDFDTRLKKYFIAPLIQPKEMSYLIAFTSRFSAEAFLKKLITGKVQTPIDDRDRYSLEETFSKNGQGINIFYPRDL